MLTALPLTVIDGAEKVLPGPATVSGSGVWQVSRILEVERLRAEFEELRLRHGRELASARKAAQQADAASQGVVWLTVNSAATGKQGHLDGAGANAYLAKVGGKEAAYLLDGDGKVGHAYDAKTTPHMYVIDKDGVLRYMGGIDSIASTDKEDIPKATQYVRQALAEIKEGKAVSVPTSEPYGCSVKYGS